MKRILFQRRTVWWPTRLGWCCFFLLPIFVLGFWVFLGESFLSSTRRVAADTLMVEGWIGREAMPQVKTEFERGGYERLVITGGLTGYSWSKDRLNATDIAEKELLRLGLPAEKLFLAPCEDVENQRTFESALTARRMMEAKGLSTKAINVVSRGAHARRTHLVYRKVFGSSINVGIISWNPLPPEILEKESWWQSSNRAKDMLDETFGFTYEALLSSGRPDGILKGRILMGIIFSILGFFLIRRLRAHFKTGKRSRVVDLSSTHNWLS